MEKDTYILFYLEVIKITLYEGYVIFAFSKIIKSNIFAWREEHSFIYSFKKIPSIKLKIKMDIKADFTSFDWAQMRFRIFICFVLYVSRICRINHSILGKHFIPFSCMSVSLNLSKQHSSHRILTPMLLDFPTTVIMKGLQVLSSQPLSDRKLFRSFWQI